MRYEYRTPLFHESVFDYENAMQIHLQLRFLSFLD